VTKHFGNTSKIGRCVNQLKDGDGSAREKVIEISYERLRRLASKETRSFQKCLST